MRDVLSHETACVTQLQPRLSMSSWHLTALFIWVPRLFAFVVLSSGLDLVRAYEMLRAQLKAGFWLLVTRAGVCWQR